MKYNEIHSAIILSGRCSSIVIDKNGLLVCVFPKGDHSLWKNKSLQSKPYSHYSHVTYGQKQDLEFICYSLPEEVL